ncbi:MAG: methyltransferase type 12 [Alphaproteobacteria bacterium HGW-Alphaproteobacteria-1]|nr:MAG: methyltransferase type 12 [Alphaproteobacteria bacterium HGW-Alphaproteobacteria-1]
MSSALPLACPVCRATPVGDFGVFDGKGYWRCARCGARGMNPAHYPDRSAERAHYDWHENHVDDPGYRRFLGRLAAPLRARLVPGAQGLDYGCGPGPALAAMLREAGHGMAVYDPFYAPDPTPLTATYDFVTCTEVAEHFHAPAVEFDRLGALLRPGGLLAVMTCFQTEDARFETWHYRKDPTHVVFYRAETFGIIAAMRGWECEIVAKDVAFLSVPGA